MLSPLAGGSAKLCLVMMIEFVIEGRNHVLDIDFESSAMTYPIRGAVENFLHLVRTSAGAPMDMGHLIQA